MSLVITEDVPNFICDVQSQTPAKLGVETSHDADMIAGCGIEKRRCLWSSLHTQCKSSIYSNHLKIGEEIQQNNKNPNFLTGKH